MIFAYVLRDLQKCGVKQVCIDYIEQIEKQNKTRRATIIRLSNMIIELEKQLYDKDEIKGE